MFGRMMNEKLGKIHFWLTFVFFNLTFFPMHFLGVVAVICGASMTPPSISSWSRSMA